ncbi:MAG: hypothetical protein BroJett026_11680 [Betaproteobacteria bacterium]|nr:MAG: hypothetical protein BroJett026_11680 [Betaproteobacteria bacterium]
MHGAHSNASSHASPHSVQQVGNARAATARAVAASARRTTAKRLSNPRAARFDNSFRLRGITASF